MIDFIALKTAILAGVLDVLGAHAWYVATIPKTARGDLPITGLSLDLYPWHGYIAMSLRTSSDVRDRFNSADWEHHEFVSPAKSTSPSFSAAAILATEVYEAAKDDLKARQEAAHLILLAGAEALLEPSVAKGLQVLGIAAPVMRDRFASRYFEYMVFDPDANIRANYCEIVHANRVTARLLGTDR